MKLLLMNDQKAKGIAGADAAAGAAVVLWTATINPRETDKLCPALY